MFEEIISDFTPKSRDKIALLPILNALFKKLEAIFKTMLEDMRREFETLLKDDKVKALETHGAALKCDAEVRR